ncbi:MAG: hypothetical protein JNG85_08815 [Spirochaetaceae bacterium]|nr:hypothetical protein [Spirochaetaceae bacterium]
MNAGGAPWAAARLLVATILLAAALPARAADPAVLHSYALGIDAGLASDSVYCVLQDREGFMWFGTFGGLSRYDGETFTNYRPKATEGALAASVVFALAEDGEGRLWVGTDGGGLARYDRERDSFHLFRAGPAEAGGLSSDRVLALCADRLGRIWAGTGDGLLNIVDPGTSRVTRLALPARPGAAASGSSSGPPVRCLVADPEGGVWAGTEGRGLIRVGEDGSVEAFTHDPPDPRSLGSDTIRSLLRDSRGRLWIGLGDGGVDLLDGAGFRHARNPESPRQAVRALAEDPEGALWVGYEDEGIGLLDPETLALRPPPAGADAMVRALYRDRRGLMWAGFKAAGIRTFNVRSAAFTLYGAAGEGRPLRLLRGMAELPDGRLLVGTDGEGLFRLDPASGDAEPFAGLPADRASRKVYAVAAGAAGVVWIGTDGGGLVARRPDGTSRVYRHAGADPDSLARDVVWALLEDPDGRLWVGTEGGGLDRLDPATGRFEHFRHDPSDPSSIRGSSVRSIYRDSKGRLWIGTWDGGLSRLDPGAAGFANYGPRPGDEESLADASVNCVFEDSRGEVWIGTGGSGLARLDVETGRFRHYHEDEGLLGSTVYGITEDRAGRLWVATAAGLSAFDPATGNFFSFGAEDGLATAGVSQNAFLRSSRGDIWLGGPDGLARFDPASTATESPPPEIAITGLETPENGRMPRRIAGKDRIVLPYDNAGLGFRIAVLDFVAPRRNRYALLLEGQQKEWSQLGYANAGTLAHLPPGSYVLRVRGANGNGVWSDGSKALSILVEPPFWGRPWFGFLMAGLGAAAVALLVAGRLRNLHERNAFLLRFARHVEEVREQERTNAAREVHDDIGQQLTVLNLQAYWLKNHLDAEEEIRAERLAEVQSSISEAMTAVKAMATRLRPIALDALAFGDTITWFARDFERRTGIACAARIETGIPPLSDAEATALFRVLQEALANVARHSEARSAAITLRVEGGFVVLELADDGVGADPAKAKAADAFGIMGMRERCEAFGGSLGIVTKPGKGMRVIAAMPARQDPANRAAAGWQGGASAGQAGDAEGE